ncbi:LOW QUALITY PROTEIN: melanoma-associated antigen B16-like [Rhynchonycteris naso]
MPGNSKQDPDAVIPSTPESSQSFRSSSVITAVTSPSKSGEGSMNVLLLKYQMKEPVGKQGKLKIVSKEYEDHFIEIFLIFSVCMKIIFGQNVREVDHTNHCYAILVKLGLSYDGVLQSVEGMPRIGILIFILVLTFIKGICATEVEIWQVLNEMGVYSGKNRYIFEPSQLITKHFVEEKYLEYQQVANWDPAQFEFKLWGPRARAETTKMQVLQFLAKVHSTNPSCFSSQYEEALEDEK